MTSDRKLRVLLMAEAANPKWRSVPLVGWSHCAAISQYVDSHLVTQVRNRKAILAEGLLEGEDFTALDSEAIARPIWKAASVLRGGDGKGWTTIQACATISNYYFEYLVWKRFKRDLRKGRFDIVHRVTPMSPTVPSPMARWCRSIKVPFVLGPLNGGLPWPEEFPTLAKQENEWLSRFRNAYRFLPYQKSMQRDCSAVLAGSRHVYEKWQNVAGKRTFYMPENGLDLTRFKHRRERVAKLPLRVLYVGRMVPYKGADLLIEALSPLISRDEVRLTLIGDGPYKPKLVDMVDSLGMQDRVQFVDPVPHRQLARHYARADILGFPSLRELGGAVVIEAMIQGVVPIVVNYGGPPEFLTPQTGYTLPLSDRDEIVQTLRWSVEHLVEHPEELERKSQACVQDARHRFTWQKKAEDDLRIYHWLLGDAPRPDLSPPPTNPDYQIPESPPPAPLHQKSKNRSRVFGHA